MAVLAKMISKAFLSSLFAGLLWSGLSYAQSAASKPTVTLDSGVVVGTAVSIPLDSSVGLIPRDNVATRNLSEADVVNGTVRDANGTVLMAAGPVVVNEYLGIPYAQSPPLRFAPPTQPKSWTSPLDATAYKSVCVQQFMCTLYILNASSCSSSDSVQILNCLVTLPWPCSATQEGPPYPSLRIVYISMFSHLLRARQSAEGL